MSGMNRGEDRQINRLFIKWISIKPKEKQQNDLCFNFF